MANYTKRRRRLINAYDLERYAVVMEDGHKYIPWRAIADVKTASLTCPHCGKDVGWLEEEAPKEEAT